MFCFMYITKVLFELLCIKHWYLKLNAGTDYFCIGMWYYIDLFFQGLKLFGERIWGYSLLAVKSVEGSPGKISLFKAP